MYAELFVADNLLMDMLVARLAAALLSVRPPFGRLAGSAALSAAAAALAVYLLPESARLPLRLPLLILLALAQPVTSFRGLVRAALATLAASLAAGGCALAVACMGGGGGANGLYPAGLPLRLALIAAFCAAFLPRLFKWLLRRRIKNERTVRLEYEHAGLVHRCEAMIDTGDRLTEPMTGLPVAVVFSPVRESRASLPIPVVTPAGEGILYGFRPKWVRVEGRRTDCVIAFSRRRLPAEAIIPPELAAPEI